jgi:hypothetical protein
MPRTSVKFIAFTVAILAALGLARALTAGEQAEIILTHLPVKSSAEYKALRDAGTPIGGRDLATARPSTRMASYNLSESPGPPFATTAVKGPQRLSSSDPMEK